MRTFLIVVVTAVVFPVLLLWGLVAALSPGSKLALVFERLGAWACRDRSGSGEDPELEEYRRELKEEQEAENDED